MAETGAVKTQDTPFEGGPMDGRVVPDAHGGRPTVLVYRRVPRGHSKRLGLVQSWKYAYDPEGRQGGRLKWPWSKPGIEPDATPSGNRDDTQG
jgi:hypothetical protein